MDMAIVVDLEVKNGHDNHTVVDQVVKNRHDNQSGSCGHKWTYQS